MSLSAMISITKDMPNIRPMIVAIWCGDQKPNNLNEYLASFVEELNKLAETGIIVNGHKICISFRCFICDSPARAFIKGKTYHIYLVIFIKT